MARSQRGKKRGARRCKHFAAPTGPRTSSKALKTRTTSLSSSWLMLCIDRCLKVISIERWSRMSRLSASVGSRLTLRLSRASFASVGLQPVVRQACQSLNLYATSLRERLAVQTKLRCLSQIHLERNLNLPDSTCFTSQCFYILFIDHTRLNPQRHCFRTNRTSKSSRGLRRTLLGLGWFLW
jgi:hypothetical protein